MAGTPVRGRVRLVNRATGLGTLAVGAAGLSLVGATGGADGAAAVVLGLVAASTVPVAVPWLRAGTIDPRWVVAYVAYAQLGITAGALLVADRYLGQTIGIALGSVGIFAMFYLHRRGMVVQVALTGLVLLGLAGLTLAQHPQDPAGVASRLLIGLTVSVVYPIFVGSYLDGLQATARTQRELARHDPLTGLLNRRGMDSLAEVLAEQDTAGRPVTLAVLDLDRFKEVNDRHGHARGDEVLVRVAQRLRDAVDGTGWAARTGGEEFALLLAGREAPASPAEALAWAQTLVDVLPGPLAGTTGGELEVAVTASIGVAQREVVARREQLRAMQDAADHAMYRAKRAGGRRVVREGHRGT